MAPVYRTHNREFIVADKTELKQIIIDIIKDDDLTMDSFEDSTTLIGEDGLFFDSIDVLELIVEIEKKYGIKIKDNDLIMKKFKTFQTLYDFICENEK
jgi:acyl carrier protein